MTEGDFVAILGLGLIGGSLARDLAARGARVAAYDLDRGAVRQAIDEGVVHEALDADLGGLREASVVVLATPVDAALELLGRVAPLVNTSTLITDVGSTKARIVERASRLGLDGRFVGAHPLAGDHRSGWGAARAGLLCGARVYVCPADRADPALVDRATRFWARFGAEPVLMRAEVHDETLAYTSHLPQLLSTALALALAGRGVKRGDLGSGGRDVTRLAGSSPEMWAPVARENREALHHALLAVERELGALRSALDGSDAEALRERLGAARVWFEV